MNTPLEQYCVSGNSARIIDIQLHKQRKYDKPKKPRKYHTKPKPLAANNYGMINKAVSNLDDLGIPFSNAWFLKGPAYYQVLAEVLNWAAKVFDPRLYHYKPYAIAHAIRMGANARWGFDYDGKTVLFIESLEAGVSTFHDPSGKIANFINELEECNYEIGTNWPHPWSRVPRQNLSFIMLTYPNVLKMVSQLTQPGRVATDKEIEKLIPFIN